MTTKLPSEKFVMNHIFAIALNGIMITPTTLLNGVAVVTIFKSSQLNSKPCYFIVLLQSMFDLAVGIFSIYTFVHILSCKHDFTEENNFINKTEVVSLGS